jgi:hypothetical protein
MHIIFGNEQARELEEKYTILELDTFKFMPAGTTAKAYAVVETIPLDDLPLLSLQKDLHHNLMEKYRRRDWNFCSQAIENLVGNFGGELDTFYVELQSRINNYKDNDPGENWNYMLDRVDPPRS